MVLTDVHTHSTFSPDGISPLAEMTARARELGVAYYGVAEHFDYDYLCEHVLIDGKVPGMIDADAYFTAARRMQAACGEGFTLLVGGEFGYSPAARACAMYEELAARYAPDFVVNSVHSTDGCDVWFGEFFRGKNKREAYRRYLSRVRESIDAPYAYDIVGHIGYVARNAPYDDPLLRYEEYADELDEILRAVVARGKILEVNSSGRRAGAFLPGADILTRYYELGGRSVSFASDAHAADRVCSGRAAVAEVLKYIGFTHVTVPDRGARILIPLG